MFGKKEKKIIRRRQDPDLNPLNLLQIRLLTFLIPRFLYPNISKIVYKGFYYIYVVLNKNKIYIL